MPNLSIPKKLKPFLSPKKFKVAYGGRGSGKSMSIAGMLLMKVMIEGARVGCMRENMNSIDDSVHALLADEILRLGLKGFTVMNNSITHESGGEIKYKGLARNPESVKSMHGFTYFWVEEAGTLSKRSIDGWKGEFGSKININPVLTQQTFCSMILSQTISNKSLSISPLSSSLRFLEALCFAECLALRTMRIINP